MSGLRLSHWCSSRKIRFTIKPLVLVTPNSVYNQTIGLVTLNPVSACLDKKTDVKEHLIIACPPNAFKTSAIFLIFVTKITQNEANRYKMLVFMRF